MRSVFDQVTIIPEKLIALYTNFIVMGDFYGSENFFGQLRRFLAVANDFPLLEDNLTKHQLVTKENEQARLINWIQTRKVSDKQVSMKAFIDSTEKTVDVLMEKIVGLHDAQSGKSAVFSRQTTSRIQASCGSTSLTRPYSSAKRRVCGRLRKWRFSVPSKAKNTFSNKSTLAKASRS
jgi:hypothetical protein